MYWTYKIRAASGPRVLMRLTQVFDAQQVLFLRCFLTERSGVFEIVIVVDVEEELAKRIQAKLYKQHEVDVVEMTTSEGTVDSVFQAHCALGTTCAAPIPSDGRTRPTLPLERVKPAG